MTMLRETKRTLCIFGFAGGLLVIMLWSKHGPGLMDRIDRAHESRYDGCMEQLRMAHDAAIVKDEEIDAADEEIDVLRERVMPQTVTCGCSDRDGEPECYCDDTMHRTAWSHTSTGALALIKQMRGER